MQTLEQQMSFYAAYHQDARNKASHFVGVPMIIFGLFIALGWARVEIGGVPVTAAMLLAAAVLVWYFLLDVPLALAMLAVNAALLVLADMVSVQPIGAGLLWFLAFFGGGWVIQLVGHVWEGRKPALVDNFFQIFVAPIFLAAEVFFALGYKPALHAAVQKRALEMRAAAGVAERTAAA
ncbi:MAG TPA: Mpo1-like protein [Burkholderiales bacterium]|nr:Mpo1-like protein [Burkholderiales bacterium]